METSVHICHKQFQQQQSVKTAVFQMPLCWLAWGNRGLEAVCRSDSTIGQCLIQSVSISTAVSKFRNTFDRLGWRFIKDYEKFWEWNSSVSRLEVVEMVLRYFHRCRYRSSPLWFFCWRGSDRTRCWLSENTVDTRIYVVRAAGA
jgi:hypothetical protein